MQAISVFGDRALAGIWSAVIIGAKPTQTETAVLAVRVDTGTTQVLHIEKDDAGSIWTNPFRVGLNRAAWL